MAAGRNGLNDLGRHLFRVEIEAEARRDMEEDHLLIGELWQAGEGRGPIRQRRWWQVVHKRMVEVRPGVSVKLLTHPAQACGDCVGRTGPVER